MDKDYYYFYRKKYTGPLFRKLIKLDREKWEVEEGNKGKKDQYIIKISADPRKEYKKELEDY